MRKLFIACVSVGVLAVGAYVFFFSSKEDILTRTWKGYTQYCMTANGQVLRPVQNDTVSEWQACAMVRAVMMKDKKTFDRLYAWAENNLSRRQHSGDNLLAWHWKDGQVADWLPATGADSDYALSLVLAAARWSDDAPAGYEKYGAKADLVIGDILRFETFQTDTGRRCLAPWILRDTERGECIPLNPSDYAPANFKIFYEVTYDERWLQILETGYYVLENSTNKLGEIAGVGLVPDWCAITQKDELVPLEGKSNGFGAEAVRVPFRVLLDWVWFEDVRAKQILCDSFGGFLVKQYAAGEKLFSDYGYDGVPTRKLQDPLFYAAYYCVLAVCQPAIGEVILLKVQESIIARDKGALYVDDKSYAANGLAWFSEAFRSGLLSDMKEKKLLWRQG